MCIRDRFEIKNKTPIQLIALDGVDASSESIRSMKYPIKRPLLLLASSMEKSPRDKFINFVLSKNAQNVFQKNYFVSTKN